MSKHAMRYFYASNPKYDDFNKDEATNSKKPSPPPLLTKETSVSPSGHQTNSEDEINSENCGTRTLLVTSRKGVVREGWLKAMTLKCNPPIRDFRITTPASSKPGFALMEFEKGADAMTALLALESNDYTRRILKVVAYRETEANELSAEVKKMQQRGSTAVPATHCYKIFVGNLGETCNARTLLQLFNYFGPITSCNVVRQEGEPGGKSPPRPFGFINFVNKEDAERAITESDDIVVYLRSGARKLNVGWSKKFPPDLENNESQFHRVIRQTGYENATVIFGMISGLFTLENFEAALPAILQIRSFFADTARHQAHVTFVTKEMATWAILSRDILINGQPVTREWSMGSSFPNCSSEGLLPLAAPGFWQLTSPQPIFKPNIPHALLPMPAITANLWAQNFQFGPRPNLYGMYNVHDHHGSYFLGNPNGLNHLQYAQSGYYQRFVAPPIPMPLFEPLMPADRHSLHEPLPMSHDNQCLD